MAKRRNPEGTKFLRYFGPLLDALRKLGGSGTPDEVAEQVATDLGMPDEVQNELLPSGGLRYRTNIAWARFYLVREGLLDSSKRGVWSLTERGRSAHLTLEQAGEIFSRWVKIFDEQRRAKASTDEPFLNKSPKVAALHQTTTAPKPSTSCWLYLPPALSASRSAYCAKAASLKSWSLARPAMEELMVMELFRSTHWFRSRFYFNASVTPNPSPPRTFATSAVQCRGGQTRAS